MMLVAIVVVKLLYTLLLVYNRVVMMSHVAMVVLEELPYIRLFSSWIVMMRHVAIVMLELPYILRLLSIGVTVREPEEEVTPQMTTMKGCWTRMMWRMQWMWWQGYTHICRL